MKIMNDKYLILVNKENMLDRDHVPENLVEYTEYNGEKLDINHKTMLEKETLNAFFEMNNATLSAFESMKLAYAVLIPCFAYIVWYATWGYKIKSWKRLGN